MKLRKSGGKEKFSKSNSLLKKKKNSVSVNEGFKKEKK